MSVETLEEYRKMTIAERLSMTFAMMCDAGKYSTAGPPDVVDRRFELIRRQKVERIRNTNDTDIVLMLGSDEYPRFCRELVKQGLEVPEPYLHRWIDRVEKMPVNEAKKVGFEGRISLIFAPLNLILWGLAAIMRRFWCVHGAWCFSGFAIRKAI